MLQSCSRLACNPLPVKPSRVGALNRQRNALHIVSVTGNGSPASILKAQISKPIPVTVRQSSVSYAPPPINLGRGLGFRPTPELGLLSLLFVLSTAIGAIVSLAIISVPTMAAFSRLGASMDKLVKLVSEEVPGTLSSLKLSGLEINDLTHQLTNLRICLLLSGF
ncbi:hypothetical protein L1049_016269 [Liquidambar formosana]|uniref:Uncharacterized protein n=1 Tax=Liquidambar formosana TaxID=63359 RepID=A0AAP0X2V8_LIQFO